MAALSWMFRLSKIPWEHLLVASVRVILRHHGITSGSLVIDDTDNPRLKAAKALAYLYKLRDNDSGGDLWGQSLVFLLLVTPKLSIPVGVVFYQPAPEISAWYRTDKAIEKQGVPTRQRPRKPAPNPHYPTKEQLALCLLETFKVHHPGTPHPIRIRGGDEVVAMVGSARLYGLRPHNQTVHRGHQT